MAAVYLPVMPNRFITRMTVTCIDHGDVIPIAARKKSAADLAGQGVPGVVDRSLWLMRIWSRSNLA
jgi:hypothetical protein